LLSLLSLSLLRLQFFFCVAVEAIRMAMNEGLTMVVGPPGTGKTDVAVQIISNLYHNFPDQRTLLVTHSNHALNDLFEKIMVLGITAVSILCLFAFFVTRRLSLLLDVYCCCNKIFVCSCCLLLL